MTVKSSRARSIELLLVGLALGLLLAFQWNSATGSRLNEESFERDRTAMTISRLEAEQQALKQQVSDLRLRLDQRQAAKGQSEEQLKGLSLELAWNKSLAGLVALHGPGVELTLNDSNRRVVPSVTNPELYLVHDYDIRDAVNLLWAAGSEAISVNDERITALTSIYCVGATIMVNETRLSPPYVIRAIGPGERQESLLKAALFLSDLKNRVSSYGLELKVARIDKVLVPAYEGGFGAAYAGLSVSR